MKRANEMVGNDKGSIRATGGCLCEEVQYEINGSLYDVSMCHCSKCRRTLGHVAAYAHTLRKNLVLTKQVGLKWYRSVKDETPGIYRGFCKECGSSLFWDHRETRDKIWISAGTLNLPTGLKTLGHVWLSQAGDYYEITDNLPKFEESSKGEFGRWRENQNV